MNNQLKSTKMTMQDVLTWCEANNFALVKKRETPLSFETVIEIAEKACNIEKGSTEIKRRFGELPFARYLVVTYMYNYIAPNVICKRLNFNHTVISYAINQRLFHADNFKYFKKWQQVAITYFINEIQLAGGVIKQTELKKLRA